MNRSEKRRIQRENNNNEEWYNKLPYNRKKYISEIVKEHVSHNNDMLSSISDVCYISAFDDYLDADVDELEAIVSNVDFYFRDYEKYLSEKLNGGINMLANEELKIKVKEEMKKHIKKGDQKAKCIKEFNEVYDLPLAVLSDLWIESKVELKGAGETIRDAKKKEDKKVKKDSGLEVVKVIEEIKGRYGTYVKSSDGVKIGDKLYNDKQLVTTEKDALAEKYKSRLDSIRREIALLNNELTEIETLGMKEIEKYTEIESVFDLCV